MSTDLSRLDLSRLDLSQLAFARLSDTPPASSLQHYDGYFPVLYPDTYTISVTHDISHPSAKDAAHYTAKQRFVVTAPQFMLDPGVVRSVHPPDGGNHVYRDVLPSVVLADPSLPWERPIDRDLKVDKPTPWLALLLVTEDEVRRPSGAASALVSKTVAAFLEPSDTTLKPQLVGAQLPSEAVKASQCTTMTITGKAFNALMPTLDELPYLAHCRATNAPGEAGALLAVLLGNRLAAAPTQSVRYHAHVVSLEGFGAYLGPAPSKQLGTQPGSSELVDVELCSLYSWSFTSKVEAGAGFEQLIQELIGSESVSAALALPPPAAQAGVPASVTARIAAGYVPLTFATESGAETYAWYRGPFSPVVPDTLPSVGNPKLHVRQATTADALMIYMAEEGVFDLSYAAAWNIGRNLALADAQFMQALRTTQLGASATLHQIARGLSLPHVSEREPSALLAPDLARRALGSHLADGLGKAWTDALCAVRRGEPPKPQGPSARPAPAHPRSVLAMPGVAQVMAANATELDAVAAWLAQLQLLAPVPFSHLVANAELLPAPGSIRFFHVDPNWLDALVAGALSCALHSSRDAAVFAALRPHLDGAVAEHRQRLFTGSAGAGDASWLPKAGVLIRSQLIAHTPDLVISAEQGGQAVGVHDTTLASSVRLCLFDRVPDRVTLAEPYGGLQFGVEETQAGNVVKPRYLGPPHRTGELTRSVTSTVVERGPAAGVLDVCKLVVDLQATTGPLGAGDFALQLIRVPQSQTFGALSRST